MREARDQGNVTQAYYWVIQNEVFLVYVCRADVKASSLQKRETWSIYLPTYSGNHDVYSRKGFKNFNCSTHLKYAWFQGHVTS